MPIQNTTSKKKKKSPMSAGTYLSGPNGISLRKAFADGEFDYVRLTNFDARIVREYDVTDGINRSKSFDLRVTRQGDSTPIIIRVKAEDFVAPKTWVVPLLGARAIVYPGWQHDEMVRTAIQELSGIPPVVPVYTHTGWIKLNGEWLFLHAGGAIGAHSWGDQLNPDCPTPKVFDNQEFGDPGAIGAIVSVKVGSSHIGVQYGDVLSKFRLPTPPEQDHLTNCIRASLNMLDVAPDTVTFPLYAAVWRAAIGGSTFSVYLDGTTGSGKSVLAALAQQHFGALMDYENLPASWSSTANALEGLAFLLKDVLVVFDDWLPRGSQSEIQRANRDADRVFRAQGNHSGRLRSNRDGTPMAPRPPRGLPVATGEAMPEGKSLNARCFRIEVKSADLINPSNSANLTARQRDADSGLYAAAMAGYIAWLSNDLDLIQARLVEQKEELRKRLRADCKHPRTASIVAELAAAFNTFLNFAIEFDVIDDVEFDQLWARFDDALDIQMKAQGQHLEMADPESQFCEFLAAAFLSERAHVASLDGGKPDENPTAWGWRKKVWLTPKESPMKPAEKQVDENTQKQEGAQQDDDNPQQQMGAVEFDEHCSHEPKGPKIGWLLQDHLFLIPAAAFKAAQEMANVCNQHLALTPRVLGRNFHHKGLLVSRDEYRGNRFTLRIKAEGMRPEVYHLRASAIIAPDFNGPYWAESDYDGPPIEALIEERTKEGKSWSDLLWA